MKNIESVRENSRSKEGKSKIPLFAILPIICQTREDPLTWSSLIWTHDWTHDFGLMTQKMTLKSTEASP